MSERKSSTRQLRIIAGEWRGRRWRVPPGPIRPSGDRVRETLFNWLQGAVAGRRCLDLYAGAGALGLEALSRGAAHCVFVDHGRPAIEALRVLLRDWHAPPANYQLVESDALKFLDCGSEPYELVFLDPPFAAGALDAAAARLESCGALKSGSRIYIEHPRAAPPAVLPVGWVLRRQGTAGAVGYDLYERQ
jgi:16S rRNA (guanine966-N2)-methyltransferase